jgi:hypothetical protein
MGVFLIVSLLVLAGPLAYVYGVDSRRAADRGGSVASRRS